MARGAEHPRPPLDPSVVATVALDGMLDDLIVRDGNLAGASGRGASIDRLRFERCRLTGAQVLEARVQDVAFTGCRLDLSGFGHSILRRVSFDDCDLREAEFLGCRMEFVRFLGCDLTGADFRDARLLRCELRGCTLAELRGVERLRGAALPWADIVAGAGLWAGALGIEALDED